MRSTKVANIKIELVLMNKSYLKNKYHVLKKFIEVFKEYYLLYVIL